MRLKPRYWQDMPATLLFTLGNCRRHLTGNENRMFDDFGQSHELAKGSAGQRARDEQGGHDRASRIQRSRLGVACKSQPGGIHRKTAGPANASIQSCDCRIPRWPGPVVTTTASYCRSMLRSDRLRRSLQLTTPSVTARAATEAASTSSRPVSIASSLTASTCGATRNR